MFVGPSRWVLAVAVALLLASLAAAPVRAQDAPAVVTDEQSQEHEAEHPSAPAGPTAGAISQAIWSGFDTWLQNQPPATVGRFLLKSIGWLGQQWLAPQQDLAAQDSGLLIQLDPRLITENPGVVAGYAVFGGLTAAWLTVHVAWNALRCMVSVGRSAVGELLTAIGPGAVIPVLLAVNGLAIVGLVVQVTNLIARAIFYGHGGAVAEILRTGEALGQGEGDASAAAGAWLVALAVASAFLALSRLAVHGVAAGCTILFVPAVLCAANRPTQWIYKVWATLAAGAFLGHVLQAALLRAGAGMIAAAFSGQQGTVGSTQQVEAAMAAIATMGLATAVPGMVGLGAAAHTFGLGSLLRTVAGRRVPQRVTTLREEAPVRVPEQGNEAEPPRVRVYEEEVYRVDPRDVQIRTAPVLPSRAPALPGA
jgi:hypothetical protein